MASIARKNLLEDIPRFLVAQAGIIFAVSLITIQVGILQGFTQSTSLLIENANADLWITSPERLHFELTQPIPYERVQQAKAIDGVARAEALRLTSGRWRSPEGKIAPARIFSFSPEGRLFRLWNLPQGQLQDLTEPQSIIVDEANLDSLGLSAIGDEATLSNAVVRLVGITSGTQSIVSSKFLFMSLENAKAYSTAGLTSSVRCVNRPGEGLDCTTTYEAEDNELNTRSDAEPTDLTFQPLTPADPISYVLVKAEPGQNVEELRQKLSEALPNVQVYRQAELARMTRRYWQNSTGVGFVLGLGAIVGVIVGMVVVGQILYSSVSDHIREFGTLKAMGASDWVIYQIIIEQALWMAVLGYLPSMALCLGISVWTFETQGITILISPMLAIAILALTIAMCVGSALFAIQKVTHVDPAIVFKA